MGFKLVGLLVYHVSSVTLFTQFQDRDFWCPKKKKEPKDWMMMMMSIILEAKHYL